MSNRTLLTVKQLNEKHPCFPIGGIRDRIFHADTNGLNDADAIIRNGRRVLIDEDRWFSWLDKQNGAEAK